jgi:hypothetical protein
MRWSELDEARGMWTLLAARAKNNHAHTLPLPPAAWAVINSAPRLAARDHLFGTRIPLNCALKPSRLLPERKNILAWGHSGGGGPAPRSSRKTPVSRPCCPGSPDGGGPVW